VSVTIFTLGMIALSALIRYGKRFRRVDVTVLFSQGPGDAEVFSGSMPRESSPPPGSESTDFDGLGSETEEARTWIAWQRSARNVTRAWNEGRQETPRNATDLYHRHISTLADWRAGAKALGSVKEVAVLGWWQC
jgi:hypothetical protein